MSDILCCVWHEICKCTIYYANFTMYHANFTITESSIRRVNIPRAGVSNHKEKEKKIDVLNKNPIIY